MIWKCYHRILASATGWCPNLSLIRSSSRYRHQCFNALGIGTVLVYAVVLQAGAPNPLHLSGIVKQSDVAQFCTKLSDMWHVKNVHIGYPPPSVKGRVTRKGRQLDNITKVFAKEKRLLLQQWVQAPLRFRSYWDCCETRLTPPESALVWLSSKPVDTREVARWKGWSRSGVLDLGSYHPKVRPVWLRISLILKMREGYESSLYRNEGTLRSISRALSSDRTSYGSLGRILHGPALLLHLCERVMSSIFGGLGRTLSSNSLDFGRLSQGVSINGTGVHFPPLEKYKQAGKRVDDDDYDCPPKGGSFITTQLLLYSLEFAAGTWLRCSWGVNRLGTLDFWTTVRGLVELIGGWALVAHSGVSRGRGNSSQSL